MLTWIDQFIKQMGEQWRSPVVMTAEGPQKNPLVSFAKGKTDYELAREFVMANLENLREAYRVAAYREASGEGRGWAMAGVMQAEAVAHFFRKEERKLALQVDPGLLEDFWGALAPDSVDYWALLSKYDAVYIDLPAQALMVSEVLYIRSVILYKRGKKWRVFCALPIKGPKVHLDNQIEIGWDLGEEIGPHEDLDIMPVNTGWDDDPNKHMDMGSPVKASEFREEVEELIKLVLLYYESNEGQRTPLPTVTNEQLKRLANPKKQRAKHQQATMFSVVSLRSPAGRFGREEEDREKLTREGYRLTFQYHRRGHFYWQAYGQGWSERRLRWRKGSTVGPKEAPEKVKMHVLRKES